MPRKRKNELPSGTYRKQVYDYTDAAGKRHYESFSGPMEDKAKIDLRAAQFKADKERRRRPANLTLTEAIDKYIDLKGPVLSPTTVEGYRKIQKNRFKDLMETPLKKMTSEVIQEAVARESCLPAVQSGKPLSPKTISNAYGLVATVLHQFCPDLDPNVKLPAKVKDFKELLPPETIMSVVKGTEIELPVLLAMWLSFTISEIRGIKKTSIKNGTIAVQGAVVDVEGKPTPKDTNKNLTRARLLQTPPYINGLIEQEMEQHDGEYLIALSGQAIYKRWSRLLEANGLPHMTFHDLRSVNASVMLMLGVPDKYSMERGGWKTPHIMKSVYQRTFTTERQRVDALIDDFFTQKMQHEMQQNAGDTQ